MLNQNENKIFQYNGSAITFSKGDSVMVNATEMAKPFGKLAASWLRNQSSQEFITELAAMRNCIPTDLVKVINGGSEYGTWMHEDVAMEFARWLSPSFAIWCNDRIKELLQYGMTATQPTLEQMIDNPDLVISLATKLKEEREDNARLAARNEEQQRRIEAMQPKADFAEAAFKADGYVDIGQSTKILGLPFGRNTLFKLLRQRGIFFNERNEPKQQYVKAGYFKLTQLPPIKRLNHPDIITMKVLVTQKGLAFINTLFGGNGLTPARTAPIKG